MGGEMAHTFPVSTVDQGFGRWLALPQGGLRHQWIRVGASSPPVAAGDVLAAIGGDSKPAVRTIGGRSDHRCRMWPAASRDNVPRGGLSSHEDKGRGGSCACAHKKRRLLMQPPLFLEPGRLSAAVLAPPPSPRSASGLTAAPSPRSASGLTAAPSPRSASGLTAAPSPRSAAGLRSAVAAFGARPYGVTVGAFGARPCGVAISAFGATPYGVAIG